MKKLAKPGGTCGIGLPQVAISVDGLAALVGSANSWEFTSAMLMANRRAWFSFMIMVTGFPVFQKTGGIFIVFFVVKIMFPYINVVINQ